MIHIEGFIVFHYENHQEALIKRNCGLVDRVRIEESPGAEMTMALKSAGVYDELLARYAQGALPAPAHVLVGAHLELKKDNRGFVSALEAEMGRAVDCEKPQALSNRTAALNAIFTSDCSQAATAAVAPKLPRSISRFVDCDADTIPWQTVLPGFKQWDLGERDGCDVHMYWIKPGRKMPSHTHEGTELFLVVEGSFTDETGYYGPGDISIADETVDHRPVAGLEVPCIGFAVNDAPLRLTGSLSERIGMFFGR